MRTQTESGSAQVQVPGSIGHIGRFDYQEKSEVRKGKEQGGMCYWFAGNRGVEMSDLIILYEYSGDNGVTSCRFNGPLGDIPVDYVVQMRDCAVSILDKGDEAGTLLGIYNTDTEKRESTLRLLEEVFK